MIPFIIFSSFFQIDIFLIISVLCFLRHVCLQELFFVGTFDDGGKLLERKNDTWKLDRKKFENEGNYSMNYRK
jgi:hypothetical protein